MFSDLFSNQGLHWLRRVELPEDERRTLSGKGSQPDAPAPAMQARHLPMKPTMTTARANEKRSPLPLWPL